MIDLSQLQKIRGRRNSCLDITLSLKTMRILFVLLLLVLLLIRVALFMPINSSDFSRSLSDGFRQNKVERKVYIAGSSLKKEQTPPKFLYLIQTEACISYYLRSRNTLGDRQTCNCEILVLNYKAKCLHNRLSHVEYIFNSSTTWATGRSFLYRTAMSRQQQYLYYVFMDDDVQLHSIKANDNVNPWRWFESLLTRTEYPLVAVDNPDWSLIDKIQEKRYNSTECTLDPHSTDDYFPAVWFDGIFNAIHYKAVRHILEPVIPYWHKLDRVSWWFSEWYVNIMTDMAFHGQAILLGRVMARNVFHRSYPKKDHDVKVLKLITEDIRRLIPSKYQNATEGLLERWETAYKDIVTTVNDTYCTPPPSPRPDLIPFKWAESSDSTLNPLSLTKY